MARNKTKATALTPRVTKVRSGPLKTNEVKAGSRPKRGYEVIATRPDGIARQARND
jgi:hypothetical protein